MLLSLKVYKYSSKNFYILEHLNHIKCSQTMICKHKLKILFYFIENCDLEVRHYQRFDITLAKDVFFKKTTSVRDCAPNHGLALCLN